MKNNTMKRVLDVAVLLAILTAITQTANATPPPLPTPDAGSTAGLLGAAFAGLALLRRFRR